MNQIDILSKICHLNQIFLNRFLKCSIRILFDEEGLQKIQLGTEAIINIE